MVACILRDYGFLYWIAFGTQKHFEHSVKKYSKIFSMDPVWIHGNKWYDMIFMLWFCAAFHSWHWMNSVLSSVCVCLQTNLLTAVARHSVIIVLFIPYMFVQSIYHPKNALCNKPFVTYIDSNLFGHHGTTLRQLL